MAGQAMTALPLPAVADALRRAGLAARVRESAHYGGGAYVRVEADRGVHASLERAGAGEYLLRGDAHGLDALDAAARAISAALAALGVRHRLEVYAADDALAAYHHHLWPPPAG